MRFKPIGSFVNFFKPRFNSLLVDAEAILVNSKGTITTIKWYRKLLSKKARKENFGKCHIERNGTNILEPAEKKWPKKFRQTKKKL